MSSFRVSYPLRFSHCDPAGIAYYPRLLELCDAAIEDWTASVLGVHRRVLHLEMRLALPTVDLRATFFAPCRLGDQLDIDIAIESIGRTSLDLAAAISSAGEKRFAVRYTQVLMNMTDSRSVPWPEDWRTRLGLAANKEIAT